MFTGIVENIGFVKEIRKNQENIDFVIESDLAQELKIDQSIAHNGCCLTVVEILPENQYVVTAIKETLNKTNLSEWKISDAVNLERCTQVGGRLDGHIVQGHIDLVGSVEEIQNLEGSYKIKISYSFPPDGAFFTLVPQGSITINGISLTVAEDIEKGLFSVAIIPYTWEHTNMKFLKKGDKVNLEFDILGKYLFKLCKEGYV